MNVYEGHKMVKPAALNRLEQRSSERNIKICVTRVHPPPHVILLIKTMRQHM